MSQSRFGGFSLELLKFLHDLSIHNDRKWFEKNRLRYEKFFLDPALEFIRAIQQPLAKISPNFTAVAKKTGGSLMRIYRDTRFSSDKSPYKTNMGIHFRHKKGKDVHTPGFYFHIDTQQPFLGIGLWRPDSASLGKVRRYIVQHSADWKRARDQKSFRRQFQLDGEMLQRPPKGFDSDDPLIEDLRRKDHTAICRLSEDQLLSPSIVKTTASAFKSAGPYMAALCSALKLPY